MDFEPLGDVVSELGEGPIWDARHSRLGYVDILRGRLNVVVQGAVTSSDVVESPGHLTAIVPLGDASWLAASTNSVGVVGDRYVPRTQVALPDGVRFNDGACDALGRFWVGSMSGDRDGLGALFRVDTDGTATSVADGFNLSNGLGWSPDLRTFYLIDTRPGLLYSWDFDLESGSLRNRRLLNDDLGSGLPDGLAIDAEGRLWIAFVGAGAIRVFDPIGRRIAEHPVPVSQPTCPAFGGDDLQTLYVTSATIGLDEAALRAEPLAGRLLAAVTETVGQVAHRARID